MSRFLSFWVFWGHFRSPFGLFCVVLGSFVQFKSPFGWFKYFLGGFGSFWVVCPRFGPLCVTLGLFYGFFWLVLGVLSHFRSLFGSF